MMLILTIIMISRITAADEKHDVDIFSVNENENLSLFPALAYYILVSCVESVRRRLDRIYHIRRNFMKGNVAGNNIA